MIFLQINEDFIILFDLCGWRSDAIYVIRQIYVFFRSALNQMRWIE